MVSGSLSPALFEHARKIESVARDHGLDFFEVVFEMLAASDVNAIAAYGGFPERHPSWRFGMDYERLQKGYSYGLSKIYELVINNDPTYAYLVRSNSLMEQKLVMAHVMGHADFFKHNVWFGPTERHMIEVMGRHAERVRAVIDVHGHDRVESFMDSVLSLDTLVDPYLPLREHSQAHGSAQSPVGHVERARLSLDRVLASFAADEIATPCEEPRAALPTYDVLGFLMEHAPLERWQQDVIRMTREEAYYFLPQRMTKIINEGWASFWHSRILTGGMLEASEIVEFADCHSGATATGPGQLNPYKLGIELFRHAEQQGRDIFQLRRVHNDVSFIDQVVDAEFAARNQLFVYERNPRTGRTEVSQRDWRAVKEQLLRELAWCGSPQIQLVDDDENGAGELLLVHRHEGRDLELSEAGEMLQQLAGLWGRPVHLLTLEERQGRRLTCTPEGVQVVDSTRAIDLCGGERSAQAG
ncbi:MAG: stage V sporulation protein R [Chlamydiales bacterium]